MELGRRPGSVLLALVATVGTSIASVGLAPGQTPSAGGSTTIDSSLATPQIVAPASGSSEPTPTVTVSGTAAPTAQVVVAATGDWLARAKAGQTGAWTVPVSLLERATAYQVTAFEVATVGGTLEQGPSAATVAVAVTNDDTVVNGRFHSPVPLLGTATCLAPASSERGRSLPCFITVHTGSTGTIPGWTVFTPSVYAAPGQGSVDDVANAYWNSVSGPGDNSIDLAGSTGVPGGVYETVPTVPGLQYTLTFWSGVNGDQAPGVPHDLTVSVSGQQVADVHQTSAGRPVAWQEHTYQLTATGATTRISFADITPGDQDQGPTVDDVSMVPSYALAPSNTRWQTAAPLSGDPSASGALTFSGEDLWYKLPILPGEHVTALLTDVHANLALSLYSDITTLYSSLQTPATALTVTELEAENPANNDQSAQFYNGQFYNGQFYNGQFYNGQFYNGQFYNGQFYNGEFFDGQFYHGQFYNGQFYNGQFYHGGNGLTGTATQAVTDSLLGFSTQQGAIDKTVSGNSFNDKGYFYVEVSGINGAYSPTSFTLTVTTSGTSCSGAALQTYFATAGYSTTTGSTINGNGTPYSTLIVADSQTMPQVSPAYTGTGALYPTLEKLAAATDGKVVDVGTSKWVAAQTTQAQHDSACPYDVNLEADAIQKIINTYRVSSSLKSVVIVGDDDVIPFFRDPDQEQVAPESAYKVPLASTSEPAAALANNFFLTDDQYGATVSLTINGSTLPVQDVAVGRLVETPADISKTIAAYLGAPVVSPTSTLTAGYTFMARGAQQIATQLGAEGIATATSTRLVTTENVTPTTSRSWSASQLSSALTAKAHQLVFIGAHFNANALLAADRSTTLTTRAFAGEIGSNLAGSIVLSAGCHAGYTIDPSNALTYKAALAWPQAFAEAGATLVAGTGFQYGDSNYVAASDQVYTDLVQQLGYATSTGKPVSIGTALLGTQWRYLASLDQLNGLEQKSLLQVTLYGLPMLGVRMPTLRTTPGTSTSLVQAPTPVTTAPGTSFGLHAATLSLPASYTRAPVSVTVTGTTRSYYQGPQGVVADPGGAVVPVQTENVDVGGETLRGIGFWGGSYTDTTVPPPLTGDPVTQTAAPPQPFSSPLFYPQKIWNPNYFGTLHTGADTELGITPIQYVTNAADPARAVMRAYTAMHFRLFYTPDTTTALGAGSALAAPPSVTNVSATVDGTSVTVRATLGPDAAGVQEVWTTYTDPAGSKPAWTSADLSRTPAQPDVWSTTFTDPTAATSDFMVQAVNGAGEVALDDNQGAFFTPSAATAGVTPSAPATYSLTFTGGARTGPYGSTATLAATLAPTSSPPGTPGNRPISFSIGPDTALAYTDGSGVATATIPLTGLAPGAYALTAGFPGDATDSPASASATFEVTAAPTSLAVDAPGAITSGSPSSISATLTAGGSPLAHQTVTFAVSSPTGRVVAASAATTTNAGVATAGSLALPAGDVGPGYTVAAYFSTPATPVVGSTPSSPQAFDGAVLGYAPASGSATVAVDDATRTLLSAAPNPATFGEAVTLTATVTPAGTSTATWPSSPAPSGTVTFYDGTTVVGTATLSPASGVETASVQVHGLAGGTHALSATYPGNLPYLEPSTGAATEAVGFTSTIGGTHSGPLTVGRGQVVLVTGTVSGPVTVDPGGGLEVRGGSVTGPISASGAIGFSLCGATVGGPVSVSGSVGFVFIGGGGPATGCGRTTVAGPVSLTANTAGVEIANSTVDAPVSVDDNSGAVPVSYASSPGPEIAGNTISGPLSCAGNTPAPTDGGQPNSAPHRSGQCATPADF